MKILIVSCKYYSSGALTFTFRLFKLFEQNEEFKVKLVVGQKLQYMLRFMFAQALMTKLFGSNKFADFSLSKRSMDKLTNRLTKVIARNITGKFFPSYRTISAVYKKGG